MEQVAERAVGYKLDREVARTVLGCTDVRKNFNSDYLHIKLRGEDSKRFAPSTFIEDAWSVVEAMEKEGFLWTFRIIAAGDGSGRVYAVKFGSAPEAQAPTMPHAICLAALEAAAGVLGMTQAGRGMDALIASKVLEWTEIKNEVTGEIMGWVDPKDSKNFFVTELTGVKVVPGTWEVLLPLWSTEIVDAWGLAMRDGEFTLKSMIEHDEKSREAPRFKCDLYEAQCSAEADTAPLAICLAFLKAHGIYHGV